MKILLVCNCSTGLEIFRGMLVRKLIDSDNEVTAVVPLSDEEKEIDAEKRIEEWGCRLIRSEIERREINPLRDFKLMKAYRKAIKKEKLDLVLTYTIKPNIYAGLMCRLLGVSYAVNITGLGTAFQNKGLLRLFATVLYKLALKKAGVVFFENEENRRIFLKNAIVKENQCCLLPGAGVDVEYFGFEPYPTDTEETRFLFIGRVMKEKGIDELLCALERLAKNGEKCLLDVLGGYEEDYKEKIEHYEQVGLVRCHGYVSDVRPFIKNCHCLVLPSWHEGMANVNLECASSGRPIITSDIHGCKEAVEKDKSGFCVAVQNKESLYLAMKKFCRLSLEERKEMGICARKRMEAIFDKRAVVEQTISQIEKLK